VPEKKKTYEWVKFRPETLRKVLQHLDSAVETPKPEHSVRQREVVTSAGETWSLDTDDEFFAEYRRDSTDQATYQIIIAGGASLWTVFRGGSHSMMMSIRAPQRFQVEAAFEILDGSLADAAIPRPAPPRIDPVVFVGHGRSDQWRLLEEHLRAHHGVATEAYETDVRAGVTITDALNAMGRRASLAVLVHTADDERADGGLQARANVIHETGFFQGLLGSRRAIILREEGCADFSNVHGMQEIRFSTGNIRETFGEVLAVLRREFPTNQ